MLQDVEWGEYRLGDLFENIEQGRRLKKEDHLPGEIPFVMAGATNTGVANYISNPVLCFPKNAITVDILGNTFYRNYAFGAGDDTGVYWNTKNQYSEAVMLYLTAAIGKAVSGRFDYGNKLRSSRSYGIKVKLPVENGEINFPFIERFIAELEAQRIAELEAYLSAAGLSDYILTDAEKTAMQQYKDGTIFWRSFNLEKLFGKSTRGKRLKSEDRIPGNLPFVTAGEAEEGVSAYIGNDVKIFSSNTTTIDMFGSAKYRCYEYGGDDHIAVVHTENLPKCAAIFVTAAAHKAAHTGKFHYGHNFYAKDADALDIMLPSRDGQPDYTYMDLFISAVQKMVIKGVVLYAEAKVNAVKTVVNK